MEKLMFMLFYLVVSLVMCNCQSTTSASCDDLEPSCTNMAHEDRFSHIEMQLQMVINERNQLKSEIEILKERLNKTLESLAEKPSDCADLYTSGERTSGVYKVYPIDVNNTRHEVEVYCDMSTNGGGWTVFQRRYGGIVKFSRSWEEYKYGFGNFHGEFWLGNKYMSLMTDSVKKNYTLRVDLKAFNGQTSYAEYTDFNIAPETSKYRLSVGTYSGTAGDALYLHNGCYFSTRDRDNDVDHLHCSQSFGFGGFWYLGCHRANLNAAYITSAVSTTKGIVWYPWRGWETLQATSMMFRPMNFL